MALSEEQKKKVFYASAIDHLVDPQRSTRWRLIVPSDIFRLVGVNCTNGVHFGKEGGDDEFALHVQSGAKVPAISTKDASVKYMGFEKYFPVQQEGLAGTITVKCLLLEDMRALEMMAAWNQTCFNQGILSNTGTNDAIHESDRIAQEGNNKIYLGLGQQENHNNPYAGLLRNASIRLELYDWMYGNVTLSVLLVNAWPKKVDASTFSLDYSDAKLGTFDVTFRYDRFNLYIPPTYKVI
jgi:hypothetical protein